MGLGMCALRPGRPGEVTIAGMISVDEALEAVLGRTKALPAEKTPLGDAFSRVLREAAVADRDFPPFNRAAMDGFAVRSLDVPGAGARLKVVSEVRAGIWPDRAVAPGEAIRIMTGAPVPEGADAVIQVERTSVAGSHAPGSCEVTVETAVVAGQNIVPRGSEARAGAVLVDPGVRISAAHLALLASVGMARPSVARAPRVAVIITGDEVIEPSGQPAPAQIRNANGPALAAAIHEGGGVATEYGIVSDDFEATRGAIARALNEGHDAIVLSGGVSAGSFDFVETALSSLGVTLHVTAVCVKPGAPFVFGARGEILVFGLPGNPVSAQVTFELFVRPALLKMQGATHILRPTFEALLDAPVTNRSGRKNFLPGLAGWEEGAFRVTPIRTQGSGDIAAHTRANVLVILDPDRTHAARGESVPVYPLSSLLEM